MWGFWTFLVISHGVLDKWTKSIAVRGNVVLLKTSRKHQLSDENSEKKSRIPQKLISFQLVLKTTTFTRMRTNCFLKIPTIWSNIWITLSKTHVARCWIDRCLGTGLDGNLTTCDILDGIVCWRRIRVIWHFGSKGPGGWGWMDLKP